MHRRSPRRRVDLQQAISAAKDEHHQDSEAIMDIAITLAFEHEVGADIWIGQWTPAHWTALIDRLSVRRPRKMAKTTDKKLITLNKSLMTVCRVLGEAVASIWAKRRVAIHILHPELGARDLDITA